jgi:phosphonate transport system substrate-binding protein
MRPIRLLLLTILIMIGVLACSDGERVRVDFRKRVDVDRTERQPDRTRLNVAVASMISPGEALAYYHVLLDYIADRTGRKIKLVQRKTYSEIDQLLASGGIDLAFICSGPYTADKDRFGFEAIVIPEIRRSSVYRAHLLVAASGPAQGIEDLRGKVFAFSDPDSNAGYLVPRQLLAQIGEHPQTFFGKIIFTQSHDNSILAVSRGLVDGAFVHEHIWDFYRHRDPGVAARVRIVYTSEPFGNPPLVAAASMPPELRQRIREIMLGMHADPYGAGILANLQIDRFILPDEQLYDPVRRQLAAISRRQEDGYATAP